MSAVVESVNEVVELNRHYKVAREKVFAAWSDAETLGKWFGPHSHDCKVEKYDFRQGGEYRIRMMPVVPGASCVESDEDSICAGRFEEIVTPERIVMSFQWVENGVDVSGSRLSIKLLERDGGTDLFLSHERLPSRDIADLHADGWQGTLECLEEYLQG